MRRQLTSHPPVRSAAPQRRALPLSSKVALLGLLVMAMSLTATTSALASQTHLLDHEITTNNNPPGPLLQVLGSMAVDQNTGDVYVYQNEYQTGQGDELLRYNSSGQPAPFSATAPYIDGNAIVGTPSKGLATAPIPNMQIAVAPPGAIGGTEGDIYVATIRHFDPNTQTFRSGRLQIYASSGELLGEITEVNGVPFGTDFTKAEGFSGVAVDPTGNIYLTEGSEGRIDKFVPKANPVTSADYDSSLKTGVTATETYYAQLATSATTLYTTHGGATVVHSYPLSLFPGGGTEVDASGSGSTVEANGTPLSAAEVAVDPGNGDLYVGREKPYVSGAHEGQLAQIRSGAIVSVFGLPPGYARPEGIAVDSSNGASSARFVYSDEFRGTAFAYGPQVSIPDPVTGAATAVTGTSATVSGTVDPDGTELTECKFEYLTTEESEKDEHHPFAGAAVQPCVETPAQIGSGHGAVPVEGLLAGLSSGTSYQFRLTAVNPNGSNPGPAESLTTKGPQIHGVGVEAITESSVQLTATVNPEKSSTSYFFEYVSESQYEMSEFATATQVPLSPEAIGSGLGDVLVSQEVSGLAPFTRYRYRVIAENSEGRTVSHAEAFRTYPVSPITGPCGNEIFRVGTPSALLPECRAYEQSSPADKNGSSVQAVPSSVQVAQTGNGITFFSQGAIPGGVGAQDYSTYLATRSNKAWETQGLLPPQALGRSGEFLGLTPDGRYSFTEVGGVPSSETRMLAKNLGDGAMEEIAGVPGSDFCFCFQLAGASTDGSKVFLESTAPLTGETPQGQPNVFAWDRQSGELSLVDVKNPAKSGSNLLPEGAFAGPYKWQPTISDFSSGGVAARMYVGAVNAITADGSQIVFTERGTEGGSGEGQLYLRQNPTMPQSPLSAKGKCTVAADACTIALATAETGATGAGPRAAAFLEATPDGQHILFLSQRELTTDAYSGEPSERSASLYRYDLSSGDLVDLTPDQAHTSKSGPGVVGFLGASDSGQSAYFVSRSVLSTEPGPTGATAVAGAANLYRYQEGASPSISFVASLQFGFTGSLGGGGDAKDWLAYDYQGLITTVQRSSRVSTDGQTVVFASQNALTGAPNMAHGCNAGHASNQPLESCSEFFRYSAAAGQLICISCNPTGEAPQGKAALNTPYLNVGDQPGELAAPVLTNNLSDDGNRFFFQTPNPLVARDTNARSGCARVEGVSACEDAYEWEAPGTGSCPPAAKNGGCVYLLSSGTADSPSVFADASPDGSDAFIITASQLVPSDRDQAYDIYDLREEGGLAAQNEPPEVPCASRQACQGPLLSPEPPSTPGSKTFEEPPVKPCKKGFVRKGNRCVKKPKHKKTRRHKHKNKASHQRGGSK